MGIKGIAIVGPTASGKTGRAVSVARAFNGEIISGDSRQVYRGMTIGTGKDLEEYQEIPYHLIDICDAGEKYNLHRYLSDFRKAYSDITGRGKMPVVCGGTGMYVENAIDGIVMPEVSRNEALRKSLEGKSLSELTEILAGMKNLHNITDIDTTQRAVRAIEIQTYYNQHPDQRHLAEKGNATPLDMLIIGIDIDREARRQRITRRLLARMDEGMVDEVKALLDSGITPDDLIYYGLEYKFVTLYLTGHYSLREMIKNLETAIHQFAKRQMTWFRGMEKRGHEIHWLPYDLTEEEFISRVRHLL